ncbi:hypothetical protein JQN58_01155 [Aneurinibacillus sp. BA2021]|nr:hypothetical protein [Aneurinibacillus sp. BA2021]
MADDRRFEVYACHIYHGTGKDGTVSVFPILDYIPDRDWTAAWCGAVQRKKTGKRTVENRLDQANGLWKIDWIKLTACGIPLLYVTLLPTFSFLFQRVSWPFTGYLILFGQDKLPMLTGLIFGYIIVDSVRKESAD